MMENEGHSDAYACTVHYSTELGRLVLRRPDGTLWDVAFGDKDRGDWWAESRRVRTEWAA